MKLTPFERHRITSPPGPKSELLDTMYPHRAFKPKGTSKRRAANKVARATRKANLRKSSRRKNLRNKC